jgi:hypothetical protein
MTTENGTKKTKETVYNTVVMSDGVEVKFPGERRLQKEATISEDGLSVKVRFNVVNGEFREFSLFADEGLFARFAAHGIEQKVGDEVAGLKDADDMVLAIDEIIERLQAGEWAAKRESSGLAGTSILARALVQVSGKTPIQVKEFLKTKSNAEKLALRNNPNIKPVVQKLEDEKAAKSKKTTVAINTDELLEELA